MYHNLTNDPSAVTSMTITGERFQEDMEYLEYNGYTPLLSADLIDIRAGKEAMPERPVMITFDDGYRSNYDIAYPILQKTGMKAVIALIGKSIRANDNTEANRFSSSGMRHPKWPTAVWWSWPLTPTTCTTRSTAD